MAGPDEPGLVTHLKSRQSHRLGALLLLICIRVKEQR
jgi:hypothetical protein